MKKLLLILFGLYAFSLYAENGETIVGQRTVRQSLVTWNAGANTNKTRTLRLGSTLYVDTSATGQANAFRRVDNTADSCSNPFPLASDTNGTTRPVWEFRIWETVRSVDKDSSTHQYRINTRERVYNGATKLSNWTSWTRAKANNGYTGSGFTGVTVFDTVVVLNAGVTTKISQYAFGYVAGSWARLCPDKVVGTAAQAGDSIFVDSLYVFTR